MRALRLVGQGPADPDWDSGRSRAPGTAASLKACETAAVAVRLLGEGDAGPCWTLLVERASARTGWRAPPGLADVRRRLRTLAALHATRCGLGLAVTARSDGRLLGWFELTLGGRDGSEASLFAAVLPQDEAAMTEGVLAILPAALRFLGAESLATRIPADDAPALRLVRRLGLRPRGSAGDLLHFQRELAILL